MASTNDKFALTAKQEAFVEAFCGEAMFDPLKAYRIAGYATGKMNYSGAMNVLKSEAVIRAVHNRMNTSTFWINEGVIINRLFEEGITASNASARINALVWVGKHIGMWKDKAGEAEGGNTYNIINYATPEPVMQKTIEEVPQIEEKRDKVALPEGVQVLKFNKEPVPRG